MSTCPRVTGVIPLPEKQLLVTFSNGARKNYNCTPLLEREPFQCLQQEWLFRTVQTDPGGYGVSWKDEVDLSDSELWENGVPV